MREVPRRQIAGALLTILLALAVGYAVLVYGSGLTSAFAALMIAGIQLLLVFASPRWSPLLGFAVLPIELFLSSSMLRPITLVAVSLGFLLGWGGADPRSRRVAVLLLGLASWSVIVGAVLAPPAYSKLGFTFQLVFACVVAASVAVHRTPARVIYVVIASIGLAYAVKALTTPGLIEQRAGDIAFGENADSLGAGIALGGVAVMCMLRGRLGGTLLGLVLMVPFAQAILATGSRAAILTLATGLLALLTARLWSANVGRAAVSGVLAIGLVGWFGEDLLSKFVSASGRGVEAFYGFDLRGQVLRYAFDQGLAHPLAGVGIGRLAELAGSSGGLGLSISAHNAYVGVFAAVGLPGLMMFIWLAGLAIANAYRAHDVARCVMAIAVLLVGMTIEWQIQPRLSVLCFAVLALAAIARSEGSSGPEQMSASLGEAKAVRRGRSTTQRLSARPVSARHFG